MDREKETLILKLMVVKVQEGHVCHIEEYPDTFAQGNTKDEAISNLFITLGNVLKHDIVDKKHYK